jgi:hypothetical protein
VEHRKKSIANTSILGANAFESFYCSAEFRATSIPSLIDDPTRGEVLDKISKMSSNV